jgi:hypothetical protein
MVGIRPVSIVGVELEYLDFGNPGYASPPSTTGVVHSKAGALFGLLYAPIPVPIFDLYGKLGVASLQTDVNGKIPFLFCPAGFVNCGTIAVNDRDTGLTYGAGVQFRFAAAACGLSTNESVPTMLGPTCFRSGSPGPCDGIWQLLREQKGEAPFSISPERPAAEESPTAAHLGERRRPLVAYRETSQEKRGNRRQRVRGSRMEATAEYS